MKRLIVGLTGGIGSGKSSAAELFAEFNAGIVDTDEISHRLTQPESSALESIRDKFGKRFFLPDGSLDRALLRREVFSNLSAKNQLEAILHPLIREQAQAEIEAIDAPYLMLVVPLLFETGGYREIVARTLVVDCSEQKQLERVIARSGMSADEARTIIAAQAPRALRISRADDVLDNDGTLAMLRKHVAKLHGKYLTLAESLAKSVKISRQ